jgi:hypothetical protein
LVSIAFKYYTNEKKSGIHVIIRKTSHFLKFVKIATAYPDWHRQ